MPKPPSRRKHVIALITDFGTGGFYVGAMKGVIHQVNPDISVIDVTHAVRPYAVAEGSFVLSLVYHLFPEGTVFLAVVDPGVGGARRNSIFRAAGRVVVAPDNGLITDLDEKKGIDACYEISEDRLAAVRPHQAVGRTFLGRDVFAPAAAALAGGAAPDALGRKVSGIHRLDLPPLEVGARFIRGYGRYVDPYGNVLTNIPGHALKEAFGTIPLAGIRATVNNEVEITGIRERFSQGQPGELIALVDSWDLIEISMNQGSAIDRFARADETEVRLEPA